MEMYFFPLQLFKFFTFSFLLQLLASFELQVEN